MTDPSVEQPTELYDFLYRDPERIASYYAQIWNGRLLSVEEALTESERPEVTAKGSLKMVSLEAKAVAEEQFARKRTVDMHDAATVDLLLRLTAQRAESTRGLGSIKVCSGTCFFLDRNIWTLADPKVDMHDIVMREPDDDSPVRIRKISQEDKRAQAIKPILTDIEIPLGFVLAMESGSAICGSIKESGLDQPISSMLFRAGPKGLANTFVVGLIEDFEFKRVSESPVHAAQDQITSLISSILFPVEATRMIPLAIYRKFSI